MVTNCHRYLHRLKSAFFLSLFFYPLSCVPTATSYQDAMMDFKTKTGLHQLEGDATGQYLTKDHRGYEVLFRAQAGNVWGRYAARVAMGEIGRATGPVGQFLTGSHEHVGTVVGSPLDRLLSQIIGQPLSFFVVLKHGQPRAPRLDVLSDYSTIQPHDRPPHQHSINFRAGSIYSDSSSFAHRLTQNIRLMERLAGYRSQYIRIDEFAVTFMFSGTETEWISTLREHGGYDSLINSVMDSLTDIADAMAQTS